MPTEDYATPKTRHQLYRLIPVLTLACTGGALLPVAASFAETGIIAGTLLFALMAASNVFTGELLLLQSLATGHRGMEEISGAVGGHAWRVVTEVGLLVLIWGTTMPGFAQVGEVLSHGIHALSPTAGGPLLANDGQLIILLAAVTMIPVSWVHNMSELKGLATASGLLAGMLLVTVVWRSVAAGLPAIRSGAFPAVGFTTTRHVAITMSDFSFMTYIQPIILPMLDDLPRGEEGIKVLSIAIRIAILGTAAALYWGVGFFGAALLGRAAVTEANILQNDLGGGWWQAVLNITFAAFILAAIAPYELAARKALDALLPRHFHGWSQQTREHLETLLFFAGTAGVAAIWSSRSFQLLTITGASSVALVCFVVPVTNHFLLFYGRECGDLSKATDGSEGAAALHGEDGTSVPLLHELPEAHSGRAFAYPRHQHCTSWQKVYWMVLPVFVLIVGVGSSIVTLWTMT